MSNATEFKRGWKAGIVDAVGQDRERLQLATAMLIAEIASIIRGDDHQCSESGIALAEDMPHAGQRCYACALIAFTGDASVAEYQRVVANIAAVDAIARAADRANDKITLEV